MKKGVLILFFLFLSLLRVYSAENIISSLITDENDERDIEVVMDKNKIYVPCKYILNYFKIPIKENHAEKTLKFKDVSVSKTKFLIDGKPFPTLVFFVKNGISGIQNEYFVSAEALSKSIDKDISANSRQMVVIIKTKCQEDKKSENTNLENPFLVKTNKICSKAYDEIFMPTQKGSITLDTVSLRENMYSDTYSQLYRESSLKNSSFNNNLTLNLSGKLKSGDYSVDFGTNSYSKNMFAFSGISPKYKKTYKNYDYILGKTEPWDFADNDLSSDIIGFQIKNHVNSKDNDYRHIEGKVSNTSIVKVFINDDFEREISTYGGYFTLKDVSYSKKVKEIRLEEIFADKSSKEIFKKIYSGINSESPPPTNDILIGINGLQNRLWANNGYIYQTNTQKFMGGIKHYKKISKNTSIENFLVADTFFKKGSESAWYQSVLGNKRYLNYTTMQNQNALSGETFMGAVNFTKNERFDSKLIYGGSMSKSIDGIAQDGLGYLLQYDQNYKFKDNDKLKLSLFSISPKFYLAGFSGGSGFGSDRTGVSLYANKNYKKFSISGNYSKYLSNFGNYYEGGLLNFDDYNFAIRANFKYFPTIDFRYSNKIGGNGIGKISSSSYDFTASKNIKCFNSSGGFRKNSYSNDYSAEGYSSYSSDYSDIFSEIKFPLGKRFGYLTLGHDIVNISSDTTKNNYNSINFQYTSPQIKSLTFNASTGIHYTGTTKGNDYGFGISKRLKSGSSVSLNYRFSQIPFYMIDNMYIPGSVRHSITLDFSELYGIGSRKFLALGTGNENKGFVEIFSYLDVNQNGKHDKGEPFIENIPFKLSNNSDIFYTDKKGNTKLLAQDEGILNVKVQDDELPTLVSTFDLTKPSRYVKIEPHKTSRITFGFISSVGNINGTVMIKDEFNNTLNVKDVIVSVIDMNGKEVNYTNLNDDGTFSFSGLSPGKYIVEVDKQIQETYKIKPNLKSQNYMVVIPAEYKNYVNIDNVNLEYKYEL